MMLNVCPVVGTLRPDSCPVFEEELIFVYILAALFVVWCIVIWLAKGSKSPTYFKRKGQDNERRNSGQDPEEDAADGTE
jgi:hypothetical protein